MAFVSDREALRTYDEARGLELRCRGGERNGLRYFVIHWLGQPDEVLAGFQAGLRIRPATKAEAVHDTSERMTCRAVTKVIPLRRSRLERAALVRKSAVHGGSGHSRSGDR